MTLLAWLDLTVAVAATAGAVVVLRVDRAERRVPAAFTVAAAAALIAVVLRVSGTGPGWAASVLAAGASLLLGWALVGWWRRGRVEERRREEVAELEAMFDGGEAGPTRPTWWS